MGEQTSEGVRTLIPLGAVRGSAGMTRRPLFAGGERTEEALRRAAGSQPSRAQLLTARRAAGAARTTAATWASGITPNYDRIRRGREGAAGAAAVI